MDLPDTQISMPPVMAQALPPSMQWPVAPPVNRTMTIGTPTRFHEVVRRRWSLIAVLLDRGGPDRRRAGVAGDRGARRRGVAGQRVAPVPSLPGIDSVLLGEQALGHVGAGGSIGFADPECGLSFGYTMNQMGAGLLLNPRGQAVVDAAYRCLAYRSNESGVWRR